jgi:hypothetical protein
MQMILVNYTEKPDYKLDAGCVDDLLGGRS